MALLIPSSRGQAKTVNYSGRPTTTWGTGLTGSGTPHALPSSPTEIIASTTYETEWIRIVIYDMFTASTNTDALVNIYIGAASSEVLFIDSLMAGWTATVAAVEAKRVYWFPLRIPSGTRISASLRNLIASDSCRVKVDLGVSNGGHWVGSGVETLGADTAASEGTDVTPGGASEGTFTSIGTTTRRWRYLVPGVMGNNDTSLILGDTAWDIGVSSALYQGMENYVVHDSSAESQSNESEMGWWCDIPSGTALQARGQSHTTPSGLQTVVLHGVY